MLGFFAKKTHCLVPKNIHSPQFVPEMHPTEARLCLRELSHVGGSGVLQTVIMHSTHITHHTPPLLLLELLIAAATVVATTMQLLIAAATVVATTMLLLR